MLKGNPDDFLQPTNPRFKKVYGFDPIAQVKEEKRKKENAKQDREDRLKYETKKGLRPGLHTYDVKDIIKYAREKNLE